MLNAWRCFGLLALIFFGLDCDSTQRPREEPLPEPDWGAGWQWLHPRPSGTDVYALWGEGTEPALRWIEGGAVQRWEGGAWVAEPLVPSPMPECINGRDDMWWCAEGAPIVHHFDGVVTTDLMPLAERGGAVPPSFDGIWGLGADCAFVAFDYDIGRFDGNSWTWRRVAPVRDLWGTAPDNVYAVYSGYIYHYDGTSWSVVHTEAGCGFTQLVGYSASEIYAVDPNGRIACFDGLQWQRLPDLPAADDGLPVFWANGPQDLMLCSWRGTIGHWNGSTWTLLEPALAFLPRINGIWGDRAGEFWICGDNGLLLRGGAAGLSSDLEIAIVGDEDSPFLPALNAVVARSGREVYALRGGMAVGWSDAILRYDGETWAVDDLGVTHVTLRCLERCGDTLYAAGHGGALFVNESGGWALLPTGTFADLSAVWAAAPDTLFVGGDGGVVLRLQGDTWLEDALADTPSVRALCGLDARRVFAIAGYHEIHAFDGERWQLDAELPGGEYPQCFWTDGLAMYLLTDERLLRRGAAAWEPVAATPDWLTACATDAEGRLVAAGGDGGVYRFDGANWIAEPQITTRGLTDLCALADGRLIAVGESATVITFVP